MDQIVLKGNDFKTYYRYSRSGLFSPIEAAMLAAEATPWLQPRCHRVAAASGHAMTLRFKAGRALDDQETRLRLFGDGRPSNAD